MNKQAFWVAATLACVVGVLGAIGTGTRPASAGLVGDVCSITAWDSTGAVLPDGGRVGGDGSVYLVFRVEDDPFGYVPDFLFDGPVQDIIGELETEIDLLQDQIDALDPVADANQIEELENEIAALEEVKYEYEQAILGVLDYDLVEIDSSTGSARITSRAEVTTFDWVKPGVAHINIKPGVLSQYVDHMFPDFFSDPDGNDLDSISKWLTDVADVVSPGSFSDSPCGSSTSDGWGFVDIKCIEAGRFRVNVIPQRSNSETKFGTIDLYCPGQADTATMSVSHSTLETQPTNVAPNGFGTATVMVAVEDQFGDRIDNVEVGLMTDNCTFVGSSDTSPAGGGKSITTHTDTDGAGSADDKYLTDNPLEHSAGTAEVTLDCTTSAGKAGVAHITAVVDRPGSDIVLTETVTIVGPTSPTGLALTLTPGDFECGDTVLATVTAVDVNGAPVSDGTWVYFTTDQSSGISGGTEGAQGSAQTHGGQASTYIATDPGNAGVHSVIAFVTNAAGTASAQDAEAYTCDAAVAPAAPTVAPPATGTGTGSITPPNTGDAGLASTHGGVSLMLAAVAVLGAMLSGLGIVTVRASK